MQKRKQVRWKIDKTLSPELSKTVEEASTPFGVLARLHKMFVGTTKLSLVRQLRAVNKMRYEKGMNLLTVIGELKRGFTKFENMGMPLLDILKPYILVLKAHIWKTKAKSNQPVARRQSPTVNQLWSQKV
ncbi:hypothetical protein PC129_g18511 [Phytophthora cactorum]|uniref:Uncharacterized protein n=1 Tax=Phytophthora cactorum TaxID=29920 RepID=A0A8T1DZ46_9STRA|nr:hypothetical protein PC115_g19140 [Phytophthora cactorum]KAG2915106.1 hypothetical protein PC114_g7951 [Phytophthora cactorum]KAG2946168.1 hypothetical protein PC117_g7863 [Phytophthora cactorum]KAG2990172.1 hypothetical protein PC119_g19156 [Phytophthora cactorum]KAG3066192.1 hypothetical protein PC122_g17888 [Phytophthora cactorum]